MIKIRPSPERGHTKIDWLDSYHSFSFGEYYDAKYMGFRKLRVINEDFVKPSAGFSAHSHHDMEIITYVLEGALEHKDSLGNGSIIKPGDIQRMTAGTGVQHSEFNPSRTEAAHFLQIWILPAKKNLKPGYEQRTFPSEEKENRLCLVASGISQNGAVKVHQHVELFVVHMRKGVTLSHSIDRGRHAWIQVARGSVEVNGNVLKTGDGASLSSEKIVELTGLDQTSEVLVFDLA